MAYQARRRDSLCLFVSLVNVMLSSNYSYFLFALVVYLAIAQRISPEVCLFCEKAWSHCVLDVITLCYALFVKWSINCFCHMTETIPEKGAVSRMKTFVQLRTLGVPLLLMVVLLTFVGMGLLQATPASAHSSHTKTWQIVPSPNNTSLDFNKFSGVAAFSPNDVWAVGQAQNYYSPLEPLVAHWNGTAWSIVTVPSAVSGNGFNAVATIPGTHHLWAVGTGGLAALWNGSTWNVIPTAPVDSPSFSGVVALSATNAWAVGTYNGQTSPAALVEHWNGTQWSQVPLDYPKGAIATYLNGITALSASDLWAVGSIDNGSSLPISTLVEHWNGTKWKLDTAPSPGPSQNVLNSVTRIPDTNAMWAVGRTESQSLIEYWNGKKWSVVSAPGVGQLFAVTALSAHNAWAVGSYYDGQNDNTLIVHWNGTAWNVVSSPNPSTASYLYGLTRVPGTDTLWAVGSYYSDGSNFREQTLTEQYS